MTRVSERQSGLREFGLLLACAQIHPSPEHTASIRQILTDDIDWKRFARQAIDHEMAELAGHTLARVAPDRVPDDILDAFRAIIDRTRKKNRALFDELTVVIEALATSGVAAIVFEGPVLAMQAYGDLGLRSLRDLRLLIRDAELAPSLTTLRGLGYRREGPLTPVQAALIQHLQGRETLIKKTSGMAAELHTRMTPLNMAIDIDYPGLWRRSQRAELLGRSLPVLAPEDELLLLAVEGSREMWWSLKWACDVAAFIGSHPALDWIAVVGRSREQGCLRMLLLATALVRRYFNSEVADAVIARERADRLIEPMLGRIMAHWQADRPVGPPDNKALASDRRLLHDGGVRLARHLAKTAFLPAPRHIAWSPLPNALRFGYVPIKIAHDFAALPLWRARRAGSGMADPTAAAANLPDRPRDPKNANEWLASAGRLYGSRRYAEAVAASDRALELDPGKADATRIGIHARLHSCDWSRRDDDRRRIAEAMRQGGHVISPFFHRAMCDSEAENLFFARFWAKGYPQPKPLWRGERYRHDKIRIAYMSVELHDPTTSLIAAVFEHHDRTRFDTTAVSLGSGDGSKMRRRIEAAFDRVIEVQAMTDAEAAAVLRALEIDIIIDLKGNAGDRRTGIFAYRPVPVQVSYLGYPGTMGVPFMDYIVSDRTVIPEENQIHYSEKVVYLPDCYMPNDDKNRMAEKPPSRIEAELPETGFIFACLNHTYKIGPELFDVWMRLLRAVDGSVLWLRSANPYAMRNLRSEAKARGVAPDRIVFASFVPRREDYFASLGLADLFLDTLPFNAHATANDALWAGLPVLTCLGNTAFARVAGSLLQAIGLPELATSSLAEYEELALALARDPARLAAIRETLVRNRDKGPLFDTARTTRNLEAAYETMWKRTQNGEPPESFAVAGG